MSTQLFQVSIFLHNNGATNLLLCFFFSLFLIYKSSLAHSKFHSFFLYDWRCSINMFWYVFLYNLSTSSQEFILSFFKSSQCSIVNKNARKCWIIWVRKNCSLFISLTLRSHFKDMAILMCNWNTMIFGYQNNVFGYCVH
jgi:hypothetical protein